jgi:predicted porin
MDVFADTIADNRSLMGGASGTSAAASFDGNQGDVAAWVTPAFNGFTGAIAYVAGAESAALSSDTKGDAWSTALLYSNGSLNANVGYEVHNLGTADTGTLGPAITPPTIVTTLDGLKEEAWKIGVSYVMEPFIIYGIYEQTEDDLGGILGLPVGSDLLGHESFYLGGKYVSGKNTVKLAYTDAGDLEMNGGGNDTGATQWTVGYERSLHRSTTVYALYTQLSNDANASFDLSSSDGSTGAAIASGPGADPSAISFGITHKF